MLSSSESLSDPSSRKRGMVFLALGTIIFSASFAVLAKMIHLGEGQSVDGRNPITFCNVLFAGNIVAGLVYLVMFRKDCASWKTDKACASQWALLGLVAFLEGGVAPALIFLGLSQTSVTSVVLIQSIEIPLVLLVGFLLYREVTDRYSIIGAVIASLGIALMVLLRPVFSGAEATSWSGTGELMVIVASILFVVSTQIRRKLCKSFSIGVYSIARTIAGGIFFTVVVLVAFGPHHFVDVFEPYLWKWMFVYGIGIVAIGQITWQLGLKTATSADLSVAEAVTPVLGLMFGFLILAQVPMTSEWIGGAVILLGICISLYGTWFRPSRVRRKDIAKEDLPHTFSGI